MAITLKGGSTTTRPVTIIPRDTSRVELIEELYERYGRFDTSHRSLLPRLRFWRKKYAWLTVVGGAQVLKRVLDILGAMVAMIFLWPLFVVVALAIKLTDGGPVFFWQIRVGQWGREFPFPKFRSMVRDAESLKATLMDQNEHKNPLTFKMKRDPRVTPIGRVIRKLSIDELPQLWCVLTGEMSLVGPRPPVPSEVAQYTLADRRRLDVRPGLTCIWQVSGRSDIPFDRQVELDVLYIQSQSLWLDCLLLVQTIPAVLLGKGSY